MLKSLFILITITIIPYQAFAQGQGVAIFGAGLTKCSDALGFLNPNSSDKKEIFLKQIQINSWAAGYLSGAMVAYKDGAKAEKNNYMLQKLSNSELKLLKILESPEFLRSQLAIFWSKNRHALLADAVNSLLIDSSNTH